MRKLFKMAAVAALALPLMVACKPNDPTNDTQDEQKELSNIINTPEEEQIKVTVENLTGIWEYTGYAWGESANELNTIAPKSNLDNDDYYVFHLDGSYERNTARKESSVCVNGSCYPIDLKYLVSTEGTWNLSDGTILLKYCESCEEQTQRIHSLTKDALVISMDSKNGDGTDIIVFDIYKRITEVTKLPSTLDESLMQYDWVLESDSVLYRHRALDEYGGVISDDIIDVKVNQFKQDLVWKFAKANEEKLFTETDAQGNVLHKSIWTPTEYLDLYFNENYSLTDFYKSLGIKGTLNTEYSNYLTGRFYLANDNKTLRYLHAVEYVEPDKRFEYPITVVLTFKAK